MVDGEGDLLFKNRQNYARSGIAAGDIGTVVSAIFLMTEENDPGGCHCVRRCYLEESLTILKIGREVMSVSKEPAKLGPRLKVDFREKNGPRRLTLDVDLERSEWTATGNLLTTRRGTTREIPLQGLRLMDSYRVGVAILIDWGSGKSGSGLIHEVPGAQVEVSWQVVGKV
ncbi:MAG: hypothetical protein KKB66_18485 [Alphaproteobacteria bacterium]|nr:hypothetical protein [Alphaproteobacteria bacterium]MBU0803592.1 hypothetical protein [Alphaproteobacteria bacterium]MBU0873111.1 hypothetical protein [Alphaproteobacteria bacterium]MBU1402519.1 hypothetical protein [Alphaproteobacteria bacterium]MBU1593161.1 hypothetical protein [Alphaproteobacteria bacterium]